MKKNKTKQLKEKEPNITTTNFDFVVELEYKTQMAMASLWLIIMSNEQNKTKYCLSFLAHLRHPRAVPIAKVQKYF
jgi:uncharacterized protein VirK/YbjX